MPLQELRFVPDDLRSWNQYLRSVELLLEAASVGTVELADTAVTADKVATDAITTGKIQNDAVTYAKIQNVSATDKLLGRSTAGAGDVEEIPCTAAGRALLDDADAAAQRATLDAPGKASAETISGSWKFTATVEFEGAEPRVLLDETDAVSNERLLDLLQSGGNFSIRSRTDADGAGRNLLSTTRTGIEWSTLVFGDPASSAGNQPIISFYQQGVEFYSGTTLIIQFSTAGFDIVGAPLTIYDTGGSSSIQLSHDGSNGLLSCTLGGIVSDAAISAPGLSSSTTHHLTGIISPAQIAANTDNYNPTGLSTATVLRLSTDASRNLTGIVAQASGRVLHIYNVGAQDLVLVNDATSTAANRFLLGANVTLGANEGISLWYDATSSRWRSMGKHI